MMKSTTKGVPFFESDRTAPVTVIESTSSQTKLMVPYAIAGDGTGSGAWDSGIAVANMSAGPNAQPGTITFDFYANGVKMSHTTAADSPGSDYLNANGMLESGGTWSALLGQLFPNAGTGHLIITTNFQDGDANVFISNFDTFSATGTVRVEP